jgi:hypothetical protein
MNANELADKLQMDKARALLYVDTVVEAANMLRQQREEIERLIGAKPITYGMLTFCKNCGQQNPYFEKAQEK